MVVDMKAHFIPTVLFKIIIVIKAKDNWHSLSEKETPIARGRFASLPWTLQPKKPYPNTREN